MSLLQIVALNVVVWGAGATYYYLLWRLKSAGHAVVWWGGPQAWSNYVAIVKMIRQERDEKVRQRLGAVMWAHVAFVFGMLTCFVMLIVVGTSSPRGSLLAFGGGYMNLSSIMNDAGALPREFAPLLLTFQVPRLLPDGSILLGSDEGTDLVVDASSGFVRSIDPTGEFPTRFMNSSIKQLGRCIEAYRAYGGRVKTVRDEAGQLRIVHELAREILEIDESCVLDSENWWSIILEQAEDGLL